ncbi:hypothetical protein Tco_0016149 [Tanacetum coccineum]
MAYPKSGYGVSKPAQENSGIFYSWSLRQAIPIRRIEFQYAILTLLLLVIDTLLNNEATSNQHPPSPDYVPGLEEPEQAPLSQDYVPNPEYLEYLVPSDTEVPIEDQPLPADASPTTLSLGYVADSDPEDDLEEDPADYPIDEGDDDDGDESSEDNADDEDEETFEDEDDDEEEEEHLALNDSSDVPTVDLVPSTEDTKAFETDESAPALPASPHHIILFSETRPRTARMSIRPHTLPSPFAEARLAEFASAPTPPLPPPSPLTPLSSLLIQIPSLPLPLPSLPTYTSPSYDDAPLGYKAAMIRLRAASPSTHHPSKIPSPPLLLPSTSHKSDIPETDMPFQKRLCLTVPTPRFEVGESSAAAAARQPGLEITHANDILDATTGRLVSRDVGYGIEDV